MPEKKRTYQANIQGLTALRVHARTAKEEQKLLEGLTFSFSENDQLQGNGRKFSREMILRLINWFKED